MDLKTAQELANFRYRLLSPIVTRDDLAPGEIKALIEEAAAKEYCIPGSEKNTVSIRSIERYLKAYREGGWEALMPTVRKGSNRIPSEYIEKAILLRKENPRRSVQQIIEMLELAGEVPRGVLKRSTVYDHFKKHNLTGRFDRKEHKSFQRYGARQRNKKWQGDTCHLFYLPKPNDATKKRKVYLITWLEDYSRVITHAECYLEEKLPMLEDSLKKAIMKFGVPETIYADNAKIYSSHHLQRICGRLGIHISHTRPYRPQGRGKVERLFLTIQKSFLPEIVLEMKNKTLSLDEINEYLRVWIQHHYHNRTHSSTKKKPLSMFENDPTPIRHVELEELYDAFLLEEYRTVDKTGLISLKGEKYQAELGLCGKKVLLRYDPYDLSEVQVFCEGERFANALLFYPPENVDYRVVEKEEEKTPKAPSSGLNYLSLLKEKDNKEGLSYNNISKQGGE